MLDIVKRTRGENLIIPFFVACQDEDSGTSESSISEQHRKRGEAVKLTMDDVLESPSSCEVTSGDVQAMPSLGRPGLPFEIFVSKKNRSA